LHSQFGTGAEKSGRKGEKIERLAREQVAGDGGLRVRSCSVL
jgi:hypothetical protein